MRRTLHFLLQAERDVTEIIAYIREDNSVAAQRFRDAFQETADLLLVMPQIGSVRVSDVLALKDIRVVSIKGYDRYFIFYRVQNDDVEVVRVLHGARDYPSLFR